MPEPLPTGDLVFDTTCGLYLAATGHDYLLAERYGGRAYFSNEAIKEMRRGEISHGHNCASLLRADWWRELSIHEVEDLILFNGLLSRWGAVDRNRGEAAAIVLARRMNCTAIVDDRQGRNAAAGLGVRYTGTVGILACIAADGRLTVAGAWQIHQDIVNLGFRSPMHSIETFALMVQKVRSN